MLQRAVLTARIQKIPTDILALLKDTLLGTGIHPVVASLTAFENETGVATITAELVASDSFDGDIAQAAQARLTEEYGGEEEVEVEPETQLEEPAPTETETSSETPKDTESSAKPPAAPRKPRAPKQPKPEQAPEQSQTERPQAPEQPAATE